MSVFISVSSKFDFQHFCMTKHVEKKDVHQNLILPLGANNDTLMRRSTARSSVAGRDRSFVFEPTPTISRVETEVKPKLPFTLHFQVWGERPSKISHSGERLQCESAGMSVF